MADYPPVKSKISLLVVDVIFVKVGISIDGGHHGYASHTLASCSRCGSVVQRDQRRLHLHWHDTLAPGHRHRDATDDDQVVEPYVPLGERFIQGNPDLFPKG